MHCFSALHRAALGRYPEAIRLGPLPYTVTIPSTCLPTSNDFRLCAILPLLRWSYPGPSSPAMYPTSSLFRYSPAPTLLPEGLRSWALWWGHQVIVGK